MVTRPDSNFVSTYFYLSLCDSPENRVDKGENSVNREVSKLLKSSRRLRSTRLRRSSGSRGRKRAPRRWLALYVVHARYPRCGSDDK